MCIVLWTETSRITDKIIDTDDIFTLIIAGMCAAANFLTVKSIPVMKK